MPETLKKALEMRHQKTIGGRHIIDTRRQKTISGRRIIDTRRQETISKGGAIDMRRSARRILEMRRKKLRGSESGGHHAFGVPRGHVSTDVATPSEDSAQTPERPDA